MAAINNVTDLTVEGDIGVVTLNSPPVNALSAAVREGLKGAFEAAIADPAVKAIVLLMGATGDANMWVAVFADVGVLVLAILNAMRALLVPKK